MGMFTRKQRELAQSKSRDQLHDRYERTERNLEAASVRGDKKAWKEAMKTHHDVEYAMYCQQMTAAQNRKKTKK